MRLILQISMSAFYKIADIYLQGMAIIRREKSIYHILGLFNPCPVGGSS